MAVRQPTPQPSVTHPCGKTSRQTEFQHRSSCQTCRAVPAARSAVSVEGVQGEAPPRPAPDTRPRKPLHVIRPSPSNPRKSGLDPKSLVASGLVEDVRQNDVRFAIELRPTYCNCGRCPEPKPFALSGGVTDEIVCGERRWGAAGLAGLVDIPFVEFHGSDAEVLERQLVELASREDVSELDQADATASLFETHRSVSAVAGKLGKSEKWVNARLRLAATPATIRELFAAGRLNLGKLALLGRIGDVKLQERAAVAIADGEHEYEKVSMHKARQVVGDKYLLRLADAPFDRLSTELYPEAGACTGCSHNTDTSPDLFSDVGDRKATCTKPSCYHEKEKRFVELKVAAAAKGGKAVLEPSVAKKIFGKPDRYSSSKSIPVKPDAKYVELSAQIPGGKTTYADFLGTAAKDAVEVAVDQRGVAHKVIAREKLEELTKAAKKKLPAPPKKERPEWEVEREKRDAKQAIEKAVYSEARGKLLDLVRTKAPDPSWVLGLVLKKMLNDRSAKDVRDHWNTNDIKDLHALDQPTALRLICELYCRDPKELYGEIDDEVVDLCEHYGVDLKAIRKSHKSGTKATGTKGKRKTDDLVIELGVDLTGGVDE